MGEPISDKDGGETLRAATAFRRSMPRLLLALIAVGVICAAAMRFCPSPALAKTKALDVMSGLPSSTSADSRKCIACHSATHILSAQIGEWKLSRHAAAGVGCYECHKANTGEPDAFEHNGFVISTIVSPADCSRCHPEQAKQFQASRHSKGGEILASLDNVLGEVVEGVPAGVSGCQQCHGSTVKTVADGRLSPASWPNTGIGRINPDGSKGSCSACHPRHLFSAAVARRPENCGRCHLGPDHPQSEIYRESKHGIAFVEAQDRMSLRSKAWRLGIEYTAAPTCVTCHNGADESRPFDHDVGKRISWTLRPAISKRQENWQDRRQAMTQACSHCHSPGWTNNFFIQFDNAVNLYNEKFAVPAAAIMEKLRQAKKITPDPFDDPIEWTYFLQWHHQGRRARHGAAMMGPDYAQWHGFFEVAENFYTVFVPQAEQLLPGCTKEFLAADDHKWLQGMPKDLRTKVEQFYKDRYDSPK